MDRVEGELSSEDHGKDLISVENLMKKLDAVEAEIQGRGDNVTDVMSKARDLKSKVLGCNFVVLRICAAMYASTNLCVFCRVEPRLRVCCMRRSRLRSASRS